MKVSQVFEKKRSLSFEIFPPKKDQELSNIDATLEVLSELNPDFISVTFGAGGSSNCNRTIELAKKIKYEYKIEPVVHLTCLHYDRSEIDEFAHVLKGEGIENILALRGDLPDGVDCAKDFAHASDLTAYLTELGGFDIAGACYPETHPESANEIDDILNLKKKVDAGASHLITQLFFDNETFYRYRDKLALAGIDVPVEAGIMPVINRAQIERMVTLCGASLPAPFARLMNRFGDDPEQMRDAGIAYAIQQIIDLLAAGVDGIHLYTMNNPYVATQITEAIRGLL